MRTLTTASEAVARSSFHPGALSTKEGRFCSPDQRCVYETNGETTSAPFPRVVLGRVEMRGERRGPFRDLHWATEGRKDVECVCAGYCCSERRHGEWTSLTNPSPTMSQIYSDVIGPQNIHVKK